MILPWHREHWKQLCRLQKEKRLPHALLFTGPAGLGKHALAHAFAERVLCLEPQQAAVRCGHCHSCQLMIAQSHPDFCRIQPEQEGQAIKIDHIRDLSEFIQKTAHQGGYRVVIIQPATAMNTYAANALLKTLEEPTPNSLLILIADQKIALPITIVSRCRQLRFSVPSREMALQWLHGQNPEIAWAPILDATQDAPLLALQWQQQGIWSQYQNFMRDLSALSQQEAHPLQLAVQWKETNMLWVFDMFFQWVIRLMRAQQGIAVDTEPLGYHSTSVINLLEFVDYLQQLRMEALGSYNLNQQLLLESLFIRWAQYAAH
jgi:DNA polymerase-3 subunit delta'